MDSAETEVLPHWDMERIYPGLESPEYQAAMSKLASTLDTLEKRCDALGVTRASEGVEWNDKLPGAANEILTAFNNLSMLYETLDAYIYGFYSTNSYDAVAARETSRLEQLATRREKLQVRLAGWLGSFGEQLDRLITESSAAGDHAFFVRHEAEQSQFLMDEALEALAAELCVDGAVAFSKLQGNVTSQLKVAFAQNGETELLPITVIRNFSYSPDAELRHRAYDAEIAAWKTIETAVAASINAVKGTAITLARRRGRSSVLEQALVDNRIDQPTLDALLGAIRDHFPTFRRYLKSKAAKLGQETLPWWDLFAPLEGEGPTFSWSAARQFIVEKFSGFHDELGHYAATAFDQNWIDAEPRDGKRGGAFCMPVVGAEESRILCNFDGSLEQLFTLAHELGHGFHNHCQRGLEPLLRGAPSTLAETASIFCETLVAEATLTAARADGDSDMQRATLEAQLAGGSQVCLDISSRFLFESALMQRRGENEVSPDELCEMMVASQAETYADAILPETYHRYMWLWKPHYYSHAHNFYNFPYAFGHLFGLGLYAVYQQEPDTFYERYVRLLRTTGQNQAAPLAEAFGIDIRQKQFWLDSLAVIEKQVEAYEQLD